MVNNVAQLIDDSYVRATNDLKRDTDYYCPYMGRVISKNGRYYRACLCSSFLHNEKQYYKNIKNTYEIISYSNYRKINYKSVFFKE